MNQMVWRVGTREASKASMEGSERNCAKQRRLVVATEVERWG
jgi:hypothetical protein